MTGLPAGFALAPDRRTRSFDNGRLLVGGAPRRALRLTDGGADLARRLLAGTPVGDRASRVLARRLVDAGLAHPCPPVAAGGAAVEVVVPAYGGGLRLDECLRALSGHLPVTVVDDGSPRPDRPAQAVARRDARLIRRAANGGPAAARNTGLRETSAPIVAFVDSDAVVTADVLSRLAAHLADPRVAAAAPRVRPVPRPGGGRLGGLLTRFAASASPLDLGPTPAVVRPGAPVSYVPSTVLVVRRTAIEAVGGFDESLRIGEDVDLVWRLVDAGWSVRYQPDLVVHHHEPSSWRTWLARRASYGSAAGPLAHRHGDRIAPLTARPVPAAAVGLLLAGRSRAAAAVAAGAAVQLTLRLRRAGVPTPAAARTAVHAPAVATVAAARWITQLWWPMLALAAVRRDRRTSAAALVLAAPLAEFLRRRPRLDPVRWTLALLADDLCYGAGVWRGCVRARTWRPLLPRR